MVMGMGWMWLWVVLGLLGFWSLVAFVIAWIVGPRRRELQAGSLERKPADGEIITPEQDRSLGHLSSTHPIALDKEASA